MKSFFFPRGVCTNLRLMMGRKLLLGAADDTVREVRGFFFYKPGGHYFYSKLPNVGFQIPKDYNYCEFVT